MPTTTTCWASLTVFSPLWKTSRRTKREIKADAEFQPEADGSNVAEVRAAIAAVSGTEKLDSGDSYPRALLSQRLDGQISLLTFDRSEH